MKSQKAPEESIARTIQLRELLASQRLLSPQTFVVSPPDWMRVPSFARIGSQDISLDGKGKTAALTATEMSQLNVFCRDNDPSCRRLYDEFQADRKAQIAQVQFSQWQPPRCVLCCLLPLSDADCSGLNEAELAVRAGVAANARSYSRLTKNGLLFRTRGVESNLVTANCGIAVRYTLDNGEAEFAFGSAERFIALRPFDHPTAPTYVVVKGKWMKSGQQHANGLRLVQRSSSHALNATPFTFATSLFPANVLFWPAPQNRFFVVILDASGGDL